MAKKIAKKKLFRYEEGWPTVDGCSDAVQGGWNVEIRGPPKCQVTKKIKATMIQSLADPKNQIKRDLRLAF